MADDDGGPTALETAIEYLRCATCGRALGKVGGSLRCASGHSFDIARHGYVSFLTGRAGAATADSAEMVSARTRFLGCGFYDPIAKAITDAVEPDAGGLALDIGGGTGFYLGRLLDSRPRLTGIDLDLSARALRVAARSHPRMAAIGSDAWLPLPVADASARVVLSAFSPRNPGEMARVIHPNGRLVVVTPTPRHLHELVSALDLVKVDERKPERLERQFSAFDELSLTSLEYPLALTSHDVRDVVLMGPSAHHVDRSRLDEVAEEWKVTVSVEVRVYAPKRMTDAGARMDG